MTDAVVALVSDKEVAGAVYRHPGGVLQTGVGGEAAIAGIAEGAIARYGGHDAGRSVHAANALVALVGDEEVAGAV